MSKVLFEKKVLIHFGKADPQGILYHARISEMAHELLEEFWSQHPLGWSFWFQNPEWAVPLRHSACDFLKPLQVGHTYLGALSLLATGESSVTFRVQFLNQSEVYAQCDSTHVFVDRKSFKKIALPDVVQQLA